MSDVTLLYYTSNREDQQFESKIIENITNRCGNMDIVSVSQEPINFGKNICVGKRKNCYFNEFRQIQIGLREIKTKWVLVAESDVLYPDEYFRFTPSDNLIGYRYTPVYIAFFKKSKNLMFYKGKSDGCQMMLRDQWLKIINTHVDDSTWDKEGFDTKKVVYNSDICGEWQGNPILTIKTKQAKSQKSGFDKERHTKEIDYWGTLEDIRTTYL